jgi:hypothetical protein
MQIASNTIIPYPARYCSRFGNLSIRLLAFYAKPALIYKPTVKLLSNSQIFLCHFNRTKHCLRLVHTLFVLSLGN